MSGFLLDTNVPSELIRARPEPRVGAWLDAQTDERLHDPPRRQTARLLLLPWFAEQIPPVTQAVADHWGMLDGESQLRGTPLNTADGMIAATAHELIIVTRNVKDFAGLGVQVFNSWEPDKLPR